MKVNTALCFLLVGISLWCLRSEQATPQELRLGQVGAALVTLIALLTLGEYLLAVDLRIDQLLMQQPLAATDPATPGRMSAATAFCFLLIGLALLGLDWKNRRGNRPLLAFALFTVVIGLLAIAGYVYGVKSLYAFSPFSSMAVHTAVLLIVASVGTLCARPDRGPLGILTAEGIGSTMARRLLPLAIVLPFLIGWLRMRGERAEFYEFEFGLAIFATANATIFAALIWITAVSLNRGDAERKRSGAATLLFSAIVESSDDAIIGKDLNGIVTSWNTGAHRIFGYEAKEMIGQSILKLIPLDRREEEEEILRRIRGGERLDHIETVRVGKSGRSIHVSVTVSPIKDSSGRIVGASKVLRDITERKRAEEALRASEAQLRSLVDQAPVSIAMFDVAMIYLAASRRWVADYGRGHHDLVGLSHYEVLPDMPKEWREIHRKGLAGEAQRCDEELWVHGDGTRTWLRWVVQPWRDVHGALAGIMILTEDITERKLAAEELRESERRLSDVLANVELVSLMLDRNARITYCNDYFLRLTGWRRDEVIGENWFELFIPPDLADMKSVFMDLIADLPHAWHHENEILTCSGGRRLIRWNNSVLRSVGGEVIGTASIGEDITEHRRAEQALKTERTLLRTLIDALPDVVFTKDPEGRFTMCNIATYQHSGLASEKAILGKSVFDFYERELADKYHADDVRTLAGEPVLNREELSVDVTGAQRWFLTNKVPLRDGTGKIIGMVGISRDISERKESEQLIRESESKYRALIEQASDGIFVSDAAGNFVMVNTRGCQLLGYTPEEMIGLNGKVTYLEKETAIHTRRMDEVVAGGDLRYERMIRRKDGSAFPAEISLKMLDNGMVQVIFHDITLRRSQEHKIARLSRIQQVLSGINSAIVRIRDRQELFEEACRIAVEHGGFSVSWIAKQDQVSGRLVTVAQAGLPMDFSADGASSKNRVGLVPGGPAETALREKNLAFDNDIESDPGFVKSEMGPDTLGVRRAAIRLGAKSVIVLPLFVEGQTFGVLTLYAPERNFFDEEEVKLLAELAGDISFGLEFITKGEKVDYLAYYDTLTGLPNRSLFFDRLTHQLGTATRDGLSVALMLMDLDRFRLVNDTLGRQAGDALIGAVAHRIKETFRDQDTVARVGADSFAVAVSGTWKAPEVAHILEEHTRRMFGQPFLLRQEELRVSATAGIAVFPGDGNNPEMLFANAEAALREAKEQNVRCLFYSRDMNARIADSLRLENRLRRALENGEMVLWYQPKVNAKTREITGFEALMRWQDPETGMVPPGQFIPLMEQTGLILQAGLWALSQVARDCQSWVNDGVKPPRVAVNVSPIQLRQKDFVSTVIDAAQKTEEAGSTLDLEITESVIMENVESIIPILQTVRGLGVEIAVDDFGTGYSSLAYIARLPIHDLKIDRSFVVGMAESEDSLAIVRSVISLAHSLRLIVVAEGVETEEQAALLVQLECDRMQGYLFSRPVPAQQVPELLRRQIQISHVPSETGLPIRKGRERKRRV